MKAFVYLLVVSVLTAVFLGFHEYSVTQDIQKAKQLFARSICISLIITAGTAYYIAGTGSLMQEPFDSVSRAGVSIQQEMQSAMMQPPARY